MNSSTHLIEHCDVCNGTGRVAPRGGDFIECRPCRGSGRRLRHTHDPRSGIDGHDYERTTTKGQVNRSGETVASEAPPQEAVTAAGSHEQTPAAGAGTGDRADDLPAPMPEVLSEDPHRPEFYRVGQTGVEPMPMPAPVTRDYAEYLAWLARQSRREARVRELVAVLRDPTNNAPLAELLDLLDGSAP